MSREKNVANFTTTNSIAGTLIVSGDIVIGGQTIKFPTTVGVSGSYLRASGDTTTSWSIPTLSGLADVGVSSITTGQVLAYTAGQWANYTLGKTDVGLGNVDNVSVATMFTAPSFTGTTHCVDLVVTGTATYAETKDLKVTDNYITINDGETGHGITLGEAGIILNRGLEPNYVFQFVEASQTFRVGVVGGTQAVATRENTPATGAIAAWNGTTFMLDTSIGLSSSITTQLRAIGVQTVSATQWGYLSGLDQALSHASSPAFGTISVLTGTATQSGATVTGTGFTVGMVGGYYIPQGGAAAVVTGYTSGTQITVNVSQSYTAQPFALFYGGTAGVAASASGAVYIKPAGQTALVLAGQSDCSIDVTTYASSVQPCNGRLGFSTTAFGCDLAWYTKTGGTDASALQQVFRIVSDGGVVTRNNVLDTSGTGAASFGPVAVRATTNQIVLGTGSTVTITAPTPAAPVTYTIPDVGTNTSFALLTGTQTFAGPTTFSNINITYPSINPSSMLYLSSAGVLSSMTLTNGQIPIGRSGNTPIAATIQAVTNQTTVALASGSIQIGTVQDIGTGSSPTFETINLASDSFTMNFIDVTFRALSSGSPITYVFGDIETGTTGTLAILERVNVFSKACAFIQSLALEATSNQLYISTTTASVAFNVAAPTAGGVAVTVPVLGVSASFIMSESAQTINGVKTFSAPPTLSSLTASAAVYLDASQQLATAALTDGQLLIGSTGAAPAVGSITGTANRVTVTGGAGSITLSGPQDLHTAAVPVFGGLRLTNLATQLLSTSAPGTLIGTGFGSSTGVVQSLSGGTLSVDTPQDLRSSATPTFAGVKLSTNTTLVSGVQATARVVTVPATSGDASLLTYVPDTTYGKSLTSDTTGALTLRSDSSLAYRCTPRILHADAFGSTAVNTNGWVVVTDVIDKGTLQVNAQVVAEGSGYLSITGAPGLQFWQGKGVRSVKQYTSTLDYDFTVDIYHDNNGSSDSAATFEFEKTDTSQLYTAISSAFVSGLQRYATTSAPSQTAVNIDCVTGPFAYATPAFHTYSVRKRGQYAYVLRDGVLLYMTDWWITGNFTVRFLCYARTSGNAPIARYRNYSATVYPVTQPTRTFYTTQLLQGSGTGFDSTYVKDPEIIRISATYYLYYSGWNGATFRSGVVSLGSNMAVPVVGTRTQLTLSAGTDNGAPSVYWDGTDVWLFLQTSAGPGASIQTFRSTTTGSTTNFTLQGTAIASGTGWLNGVYDPTIVRQTVGGLYYLYFTATASTMNTAGYTRTQGLATASSLSGPWTVVGQVRCPNAYDNITYGCEAPNVFYYSTTGTFHMQITGGHLAGQEVIMSYHSWDGINFYPSHDFVCVGPGLQTWNVLATGSGSWIVDIDDTLYVLYQAQPSAGGSYSIGYYSVSAADTVQRALVLPFT